MRNSKNITSFTPVCKKNTLAIKHNPVYAIVDKFFNEHTAAIGIFIKHNEVKKMRSANAYLIKIPQDTTDLNIFASSGYVLSARHLRIDEFYNRNEYGLMPAHYTEVYVNAAANSKIVLHAYFNSVGIHIHTKIKQIDLSTTIKNHLEISAEMHQYIVENLNTASIVLYKLLKYKNEAYKEELKNAEGLEEELGKLYGTVNTITGLEAYRIKAVEFCACMDKINALNEINTDTRGEFVAKQLVKISQRSCANNAISEIVVEDLEPVLPNIHHPVKTRKPKKSVNRTQDKHKSFACITKEIQGYVHIINKMQIQNIVVDDLHEQIYAMQDASIALFYFSAAEQQQMQGLHNQLIESIGKAKSLIAAKIEQLMNAGNVKKLTHAIECGRNYINFATCYKFVESLIYMSVKNKNDLAKVNRLIAVCDLLYSKSDIFKNAASTLACGLHNINNVMCVSILLEVYHNKNLPVFKKIIEYGTYINLGVYSIKDNKYLSLITMLTFLSLRDNNFEYVDVLLGNNVAMLSGRDLTKISSLDILIDKNTPKNAYKEQMLNIYNAMFSGLYEYTPLEMLLQYDNTEINYELLEKLVSVSNFKSLALILAGFVNHIAVKTMFVPSVQQHGIYMFEISDEKQKFADTVLSDDPTSGLLYLMSTVKNSVEGIVGSAQLLCKMFNVQGVGSINNHQINLYICQISNDCMAVATNAASANYQLIQQTACLLLLALKPELNLDDSRKALKFFNNIKKLTTTYSNNTTAINVATNRMAVFLNTNKFKDELKQMLTDVAVQQLTMDNDAIKKSKIAGLLLGIALAVQRNDYAKLTSIIADRLYPLVNINSPVAGGEGKTVLHYACLGQSYPCAKLLILLGASIECKDHLGHTPVDLPDLTENIKNTIVKLYHVYQDILEESPECIQIFAMQKHNENEECLNCILPIIAEIEKEYASPQPAVSQIFLYKPNVGAQNIAIRLPATLPDPRILINNEIKELLSLR